MQKYVDLLCKSCNRKHGNPLRRQSWVILWMVGAKVTGLSLPSHQSESLTSPACYPLRPQGVTPGQSRTGRSLVGGLLDRRPARLCSFSPFAAIIAGQWFQTRTSLCVDESSRGRRPKGISLCPGLTKERTYETSSHIDVSHTVAQGHGQTRISLSSRSLSRH